MRLIRRKNSKNFSQHQTDYNTIPFSDIISIIKSGLEKDKRYEGINILDLYPYGKNKIFGVRFEPKLKGYTITMHFRSIKHITPQGQNSIKNYLDTNLDEKFINEYESVWQAIDKQFERDFYASGYDIIDIYFEYNQRANSSNGYKDNFLEEYKNNKLIDTPSYKILLNFKVIGYMDGIEKDIVVIRNVPNFAVLPIAKFINQALL
ncbi:MAG: hypothetical protein QXF12_02315 [Candidatus Aenigmatarchaeota archaeon]